ncbi:MAG: transketolase [Clostridia bacterium]
MNCDYQQLKEHATNIRKNIIKMTCEAKSGHPGGSLSITDIITILYFNFMNINVEGYQDPDRDRFVLSKGHAAPALYAVLAEKGFIEEKELMTLRKLGSRLQGHPDMKKLPYVEMSTGSLGQGLSAAVGMALSAKIDDKDYYTYAIVGDGEIQEGQIYEASMFAAHYSLGNLIVFLDNNGLQIDGDIKKVMDPNPLPEKWKAFNWHVQSIDGHNYDEICQAVKNAQEDKERPSMIVAKTIKGKGVSFMENKASWHGSAPCDEEKALALAELEESK